MSASDETPTMKSVVDEVTTGEEVPEMGEKKEEETLGSTEAQMMSGNQGGGEESSSAMGQASSALAEEECMKPLDYASELMEKGSIAMKACDYAEAAECFSRAVEIRVAHYGEIAPECSSAYYKYGCALLYKAQEEADPLGSVPKKEDDSLINSEKDGSATKGECSSTSVVADEKQEVDSTHNKEETNDGASEKDQVEVEQDDDNEESEAEDLAEPDEDESDLDLAWKMLDVARAIVEKNPNDTMEKVDILSALGEVALEREDIEISLNDYMSALSILERLVEKDSRHIAELNFRICLVLEVGSRGKEAIPFCEKAISICKARLQRLTEEVKEAKMPTETAASDINQKADQAIRPSHSDSSTSCKEAEITTLTELSSELEKKLEDLQQLVSQPSSLLSEVLSMISAKAAKATGDGKNAPTSALSSSRIGTESSGGDFDSPTVSTAHTNSSGGVTHLGVVGRGVKRVLMNSNDEESSPMKEKSLKSSEEKDESSVP